MGRRGRTSTSHVCTLPRIDATTFVYAQATPIAMEENTGLLYRVDGAFVSRAGAVSPVAASYDYGGNHANDSMTVEVDGTSYRDYHSSFGFGWRRCQPMDCLQLQDGATLLEDGCTPERTIPAVCVEIQPDGTEAPLVDAFERCPGDPNGA